MVSLYYQAGPQTLLHIFKQYDNTHKIGLENFDIDSFSVVLEPYLISKEEISIIFKYMDPAFEPQIMIELDSEDESVKSIPIQS